MTERIDKKETFNVLITIAVPARRLRFTTPLPCHDRPRFERATKRLGAREDYGEITQCGRGALAAQKNRDAEALRTKPVRPKFKEAEQDLMKVWLGVKYTSGLSIPAQVLYMLSDEIAKQQGG